MYKTKKKFVRVKYNYKREQRKKNGTRKMKRITIVSIIKIKKFPKKSIAD